MTVRRRPSLEVLQWVGLLGGALTWTAQLVIGYGVTVASCSRAGAGWRVDVHAWEIGLTATAAVLVLVSEGAAVAVYRETRGLDYSAAPPEGRRHFFASAALVGNLLFLVVVLLSGLGALALDQCRGA
jgi:hypothetical protein